MAKLIYSGLASLDGYVADGEGKFDWAEPSEEVHAFVNELVRPAGTHVYGRRLYEVMAVWEDLNLTDEPASVRDFAEIWRGADKVVYSRTLQTATTARTRIEREFEAEAVRQMKVTAERDIIIGGPTLAAPAFKAGLVDECHLFLSPIIVGSGLRSLPAGVRLRLKLLEERRFGNGTVYLHYHVEG